jgi:hypothetical protein
MIPMTELRGRLVSYLKELHLPSYRMEQAKGAQE